MLLAAHRRALTPFSRWKTGLLDMTAEPDGRNRWCVASPAVPRAASGPFRRQQWLPLRAALACVARCDRATSPDGAGSRRGVPFGGAAFAWRLPVPVATPAETHVSRTLAAADAFTHGAACTPSRARRALTAAWPRTLRRPRACPARCVALHPSMRNNPRAYTAPKAAPPRRSAQLAQLAQCHARNAAARDGVAPTWRMLTRFLPRLAGLVRDGRAVLHGVPAPGPGAL